MISKIVITGGPCAGKSTALVRIKKEFSKLGYKVITVSETATEMISAGVTLTECGAVTFQKNLLLTQLRKEESAYNCAKALDCDKILLVCDRGAMDSSAYLSESEFLSILNECGLSRAELRDGYDAVFHLVTAADGAREFYTLENNEARTETIEEAIESDGRLISAWTGHPHLRIIGNSGEFEQKMNKLITEISSFLGEPKPLEIERKYIIKYPDIEKLEAMPFCHGVEIEQIYYKDESKSKLRIRKRGEDGSYVYFKTQKIRLTPMTQTEIESRITADEYESILLSLVPPTRKISKKRYCLVYDEQYFEIDIYPFWSDIAVMEIELCNENQEVRLPKFVEVIEEVTGNSDYSNYNLASRIE